MYMSQCRLTLLDSTPCTDIRTVWEKGDTSECCCIETLRTIMRMIEHTNDYGTLIRFCSVLAQGFYGRVRTRLV
jgi:hypothetical protein